MFSIQSHYSAFILLHLFIDSTACLFNFFVLRTWARLLIICLILFALTCGFCAFTICCCASFAFNESKKLWPGPILAWAFILFVAAGGSSILLLDVLGLSWGANFAFSDAMKLDPTPPGPRNGKNISFLTHQNEFFELRNITLPLKKTKTVNLLNTA